MPSTEISIPQGWEPSSNTPQSSDPKLYALTTEHDDLDRAIAALLKAGTCDDLLIARLKKRKLQIKDRIALRRDWKVPANAPSDSGKTSMAPEDKYDSGLANILVLMCILWLVPALLSYMQDIDSGWNTLSIFDSL